MKRFQEYVTEQKRGGAKKNKVSATDMEAVIVVAFNGGWDKAKDTYGLKQTVYESGEKIAQTIADDIRKTTKASPNSLIHFGSGAGQLNPKWLGSNGTPKTDLYSTDGINISLKQKGGSQVMSGYKEETISTFYAAMDSMGDKAPKEIDKLIKKLDPVLRKITVPGNVNTIINSIKGKSIPKGIKAKQASGKVMDIKFDKREYAAKQAEIVDWKAAMQELNPVFREFFEANTEFRRYFVYEAATGDFKFAPDKYANSNWMVEFDPEFGSKNNIVQLSLGHNQPAPFIDKLAKKVTVRISPKTPTGSKVTSQGTASTVGSFRLTVAENSFDTFETMMLREQTKFTESLLTEGVLTEAGLFSKLKTWLSKLYYKVIKKIKQIAKLGYEALMSFFQFEVSKVETSGLQQFGFK